MAAARGVGDKAALISAPASIAVTLNLTAGRSVVVMAASTLNTTLSCSDGVNSYQTDSSISAGNGTSYVFSAANVAGASTTITVTPAASAGGELVLIVREYSGMILTAIKDVAASHNFTSNETALDSDGVATTVATELLVGFCFSASHRAENFTAGNDDNGNTYTADQTTYHAAGAITGFNEDFIQTAATATRKATCTQDNAGQAHMHFVAYKVQSPAALTGTATAGITEADIVTGGKTIILTLTGDTFIAA